MKASSKRFFALTLAVFFFGFATYLLANVSLSRWAEVNTLRTTQAEHLGVRNQMVELVAKANELFARYADFDQRARPITAALPAEERLAEIAVTVGVLARQHNLLMSRIIFDQIAAAAGGRERERGEVSQIGLTVGLTGRYESFKGWLKDIESELRLMDVTEFSLQPITEQAAEATLDFQVHLRAYWQPPLEPVITRP
ncbi:MAG: type 4a pilus biogenesis protein PilO [Parcubacteria group bacterium]|nr:type 4a pilus biogenesis protein PilO [Parcubacteria group bacterium]